MLPDTITIHNDPSVLITDFFKDKNYTRVGVLFDENTEKNCYPLIESGLPPHQTIKLKSGEEHKNLAGCEEVWNKLTDYSFDRHSLLVVLGGGVLGDLGGFCAATFKRGIDFVLVPTTLLAQADASVGGKLGIDFQGFKNHIGLFRDPVRTLISPRFLKTLAPRELRSGFAEVVKHALISDRKLWTEIRPKTLADQHWDALIRHSVEFKANVVKTDPYEKGLRKILNFGHTVGHAIEGHFLDTPDRLLHGEAIAMGMAAESFIAFKAELLSGEELSEVIAYLTGIFGPFRELKDKEDILARMGQDKKNLGVKILMALPDGIGKARWDVEVNKEQITESLSFLRSLYT